ncbi:Uncharacterized protein APZ42_004852, partial [Daphnia magna]
RCAAHLLQIAVLDEFKLKSVNRLIAKARAAMKALKNPVFMVSIRRS